MELWTERSLHNFYFVLVQFRSCTSSRFVINKELWAFRWLTSGFAGNILALKMVCVVICKYNVLFEPNKHRCNKRYEKIKKTAFLARDSMLSALYAIANPSVRLSVRLSVCHTGGSVENG